jgi:hypothetical protein
MAFLECELLPKNAHRTVGSRQPLSKRFLRPWMDGRVFVVVRPVNRERSVPTVARTSLHASMLPWIAKIKGLSEEGVGHVGVGKGAIPSVLRNHPI